MIATAKSPELSQVYPGVWSFQHKGRTLYLTLGVYNPGSTPGWFVRESIGSPSHLFFRHGIPANVVRAFLKEEADA